MDGWMENAWEEGMLICETVSWTVKIDQRW